MRKKIEGGGREGSKKITQNVKKTPGAPGGGPLEKNKRISRKEKKNN